MLAMYLLCIEFCSMLVISYEAPRLPWHDDEPPSRAVRDGRGERA